MSTRVDKMTQWRDLMRSWGFTVLETAGWQTRDAEPRTSYDPSQLFLEHHDASSSLSGNWGALAYVTTNKLAQLVYSRDGQAMIVAAGVCWHAGVGGPFANVPANSANRLSTAVEVANSGSEPYSPALTRLIVAGEAAWCIVHNRSTDRVIGHKEWATPRGRKTDPSIDMNRRRADVAAFIANQNSQPQEEDDMPYTPDELERAASNGVANRVITDLNGKPIHTWEILRDLYHGQRAENSAMAALTRLVAEQNGLTLADVRQAVSEEIDESIARGIKVEVSVNGGTEGD